MTACATETGTDRGTDDGTRKKSRRKTRGETAREGGSPGPGGTRRGPGGPEGNTGPVLVLVPPTGAAPGAAAPTAFTPDPAVPAAFAPAAPPGVVPAPLRTRFTVAPDGSYAACLAVGGDGVRHVERWTLDGQVPYTVALPGAAPEGAGTRALPLPDGRVLVLRESAGRYDLALLYPCGARTGEVPVGFLYGEEVRLMPPLADGRVFAVAYGAGTSTVWQVHGGPGLERRAELAGRCTGGVWLDAAGRLLALDRERDGRVRTVAADLATGVVTPLLQIGARSEDRLLLADPGSGLLLVRSDAPGTARLGWGVLGSGRPVRFPDCLCDPEAGPGAGQVEPVAVQPGDPLAPEACAVLLRIGGRAALWRPYARRPACLPTPPGWLAGSAWWSGRGTLRMPYAGPDVPYGVRDIDAERYAPRVRALPSAARHRPELTRRQPVSAPGSPPAGRVVPLQQAPLGGDRHADATSGAAETSITA